jgi:hypothetical protein
MVETAYAEVGRSLRAYDSDGGQLFEARVRTAEEAVRRAAKEMADLCNTEQAALIANAEIAIYEAGLIANGISPMSVSHPARYADYYRN